MAEKNTSAGPVSHDPPGDKQRALKLVTKTSDGRRTAELEEVAAMRFAKLSGASLREIGDAAGIPFATVKRMIDRAAGRSGP